MGIKKAGSDARRKRICNGDIPKEVMRLARIPVRVLRRHHDDNEHEYRTRRSPFLAPSPSISNLKRNVVVATAHRCGYRNLLTLKNLRKKRDFFLGQENELLRCSHAYIAVGTILDLLLLLLLSSRLAKIAAGPPEEKKISGQPDMPIPTCLQFAGRRAE